jgi:hypothetical protein
MSCEGCELTVSNEADELNLVVTHGIPFGPIVMVFTDDNDDPIDITGSTFVVEVRETHDSDDILATVNGEIVDSDDDNTAQFMFDDELDALVCGTNPRKRIGKYAWRLRWTTSDGSIVPVFRGELFLQC